MAAIEVENLHKTYGAVRAVNGVSFTVAEGEVFALLGPNGAGKTTVVEILEGYRTATVGRVQVLGFDPARGGSAYRDRIGIVLQEPGIEQQLTVLEVIDLYASFYSRRRPAPELVALVGLEEKSDARIKTLSGGQRRRLDLALALAGDPDLIFLDEPTTGFDPSARRSAWELVQNLTELGKTILLTTHYMDEAQHLADRMAVINAGRIVAEGSPAELSSGLGRPTTTISFILPPAVDDLPQVEGIGTGADGRIRIVSADPTRDLHTLTSWAIERGIELEGLEVARPSLEDTYLEIIAEETT